MIERSSTSLVVNTINPATGIIVESGSTSQRDNASPSMVLGFSRCMWTQAGNCGASNSSRIGRWSQDCYWNVWWEDVEVIGRQLDDGAVVLLES